MIDLGPGFANGINASGEVVGFSTNVTDDSIHAVLWIDGKKTDMGTLPGGLGSGGEEAQAINSIGQVVGYSYIADNVAHAFLYDNGSMTDLNSLIPSDSGWTLAYASDINDSGEIVGYGTNLSGQTHAFLLNPVPEPSIVEMLGVAAIGWLGYGLRRRTPQAMTAAIGIR